MYVGMGGGFDVCGAIPIHNTLQTKAIFVSIGNDISEFGKHKHFQLSNTLGAADLSRKLKELVVDHDIDLIIAIDGGVDGLMVGDEENPGTVLHDFNTLAAISRLTTPAVAAFLGFGCETDEQLNHYRALENIATLIGDGAFYGSCSLIADAEYEKIVGADHKRRSHIQTRVIDAMKGGFGDEKQASDPNLSSILFEKTQTFINPLMGIYWFFNLEGVVRRNRIIPEIYDAETIGQAFAIHRRSRLKLAERVRLKQTIPL